MEHEVKYDVYLDILHMVYMYVSNYRLFEKHNVNQQNVFCFRRCSYGLPERAPYRLRLNKQRGTVPEKKHRNASAIRATAHDNRGSFKGSMGKV